MEEPVCFENYDLESIITPVKVDKLVRLLHQAHYPSDEVKFLEDGFRQGFSIGYEGPEEHRSFAANIPFSVGNETILWNKLIKEISLKRVAGPFDKIPFDNFGQSPIGLVPKAGSDQTRLIFHLSYDFKGKGQEQLQSVNFYTPREVLCKI